MYDDLTQEQHAEDIANSLKSETVAKYMRGAAEHQGKLWEEPASRVIDFAIEEAIDQGVYLKTLQMQLNQLTGLFKDLLAELSYPVEEPPLTSNGDEIVRQMCVLLGIQ